MKRIIYLEGNKMPNIPEKISFNEEKKMTRPTYGTFMIKAQIHGREGIYDIYDKGKTNKEILNVIDA